MNKIIIGFIILIVGLVFFMWPSSGYPIVNRGFTSETIIAFGDSWTAGIGAKAQRDYPSFLSQKINRTVMNEGVSGNTTEQALVRLESDVLDEEPGVVIILLGGNDIRKKIPLEKTLANLETMIARIQGQGAMVVLVGFKLPLHGNYHDAYLALAREKGCVFVADILSGIFFDSALMYDRVHPNGKGYEKYASKVFLALKEYLK